jgi:molybdopterin/thiamine biosynthesis adenylyltransferase
MTSRDGRYARQELFKPFGAEGQARLRAARVLVAGCGGLGATTASLLARAGVGLLRVVDRDVVELSNLQRQALFCEADAREGVPKAAAAEWRIAAVNSDVRVEAVVADVEPGNVLRLVDGMDLALDGFDNFEARYLLNDACVKRGTPWVYGACVGATAVAGLVVPGTTPCLRCLHRELPAPGAAETCETAGILGPAASLAASMQASLALRFLATGAAPAEASLFSADAWDLRMDALPLPPPAPSCPCCGERRFEFLDGPRRTATTLCGRDAVQVRPLSARPPDLAALAERLRAVGAVRANALLVRLDAPPYELTVFDDGRAIVKGTHDEALARGLVARWLGV